MRFFFYGTLCDPDVRVRVLGYHPSPRQVQPARLCGYRRKQARGKPYPVLVRSPRGQVDGVLFSARPADAAALAAYEGAEYRARRLPITRVSADLQTQPRRAFVFLPALGPQGTMLPASHADWNPLKWRRRDKAVFLLSLQTKD